MHDTVSIDDKRRGISRRKFGAQLAIGAAAMSPPLIVPRTALSAPGRPGANDRVDVALFDMGTRGKQLVELAKRRDCILQAGTQSRSIPLNQLLLCGIRDGRYGKLRAVVCRSHRISYDHHATRDGYSTVVLPTLFRAEIRQWRSRRSDRRCPGARGRN